MKKILSVIMAFTLVFNLLGFPVALAATGSSSGYDHEALLEYEGYGQALYESIVEETAFVTGKYTENKEYVSGTIDKIVDYAKFWWDEQKIEGDTVTEKLKDMFVKGSAHLLTVGDWIRQFFNDTDEKINPPVSFDDFYSPYFTVGVYAKTFAAKSGYQIQGVIDGKTYGPTSTLPMRMTGSALTSTTYKGAFAFGSEVGDYRELPTEEFNQDNTNLSSRNLGTMMSVLAKWGASIVVYKDDKPLDLGSPDKPTDDNYRVINNYVQSGMTNKEMVTPQPRPTLVCPAGEKITLTIDGSVFIGPDGEVVSVNKDGTAIINGTSCSVNWEKPAIKYEDDKALIQTPDDKWQDIETGEIIGGSGGDQSEGCDGVLCFLGKLLDAFGDLVSAIGDVVTKILDGILGLFVPDNLDFITDEFDTIKKDFDDKLGVLSDIKTALTGSFTEESENPLKSVTLDLPILNKPIVFDTSIIEGAVPTLKKVISGVMVLFTLLYIYRKITGRGGVMEK